MLPTGSASMNRRTLNSLFVASSCLAVGICIVVLAFLIAVIVWNGLDAISFEFLCSAARNFGAEGGILFQILGTLLLIFFAALFCFPLALGSAIFQSEYIKRSWIKKLIETLIYGLNGVPSILFGIFGLIFFVNVLNTGISWFVGSLILAMMILPTVTLAAYQSINSVPRIYRETALACGFNRWQMIVKVLLPRGIAGGITGLLLGLARAAGETAPIMFIGTAFSGVDLPDSIYEPVTALPTHILALAYQATNPQALRNAWGASLVLLGLVFLLSISALFARRNFGTVEAP